MLLLVIVFAFLGGTQCHSPAQPVSARGQDQDDLHSSLVFNQIALAHLLEERTSWKEDTKFAVLNITNDVTSNLKTLHKELKAEIVSELKEAVSDQESQLRTSLEGILKDTLADQTPFLPLLSGLNATVNALQLQMKQLGNELSNRSLQQQAESYSEQQRLLDEQSDELRLLNTKIEEQDEALRQKDEQLQEQEAAFQEMETKLQEQKQNLLSQKTAEMLEQEQSLREHEEKLQQLSERSQQMEEELQQTKDDLTATEALLQKAFKTIRNQNDTIIQQQSLLAMQDELAGIEALDCVHHWQRGRRTSGVYTIYPIPETPGIEVWCDMSDEGPWTVILSRRPQPVQEDFSRDWGSYKEGFGNASAEYWIGLQALHAITNRTEHELRVEVRDYEGHFYSGGLLHFHVDDESVGYMVTMQDDYGIGYPLANNDGDLFSTIDEDNDSFKHSNCARFLGGGGWWYGDCSAVYPTGRIAESNSIYQTMHWLIREELRYAPLTHIIMGIRPSAFEEA